MTPEQLQDMARLQMEHGQNQQIEEAKINQNNQMQEVSQELNEEANADSIVIQPQIQ